MIQSNRYLVCWHSAVTGEHHETFGSAERVNARLDEVEERAYFERGVVIDQIESGAQLTPEEFRHIHDSHPGRTRDAPGAPIRS